MRPHFHTDGVQLTMTALGVLVIIHAIRLTAIAISKKSPGVGKAVAAFALAD